jgi:hypothetical protein
MRRVANTFVATVLLQLCAVSSGGAMCADRLETSQVDVPKVGLSDVSGMVDLRVTHEGGIAFDGGGLSVNVCRPGWSRYNVKPNWRESSDNVRRFSVYDGSTRLFDGKASWTMQEDGAVKGTVSLLCIVSTEAQYIALAASIPSLPTFGLGDGTLQDFVLPIGAPAERATGSGRMIMVHFDEPVCYHSQDSRRWGKKWSVRFGADRSLSRRTYAAGDRLEWNMTISSPNGLSIRNMKPSVISENDIWIKMDYRKNIKPGSALDFSNQGLQDAPAGKYGWLKAVGGHFEFEGLTSVEQRFYGVNLCYSANYLDHAMSDMLVDRLVRCGYNTIRVHHHDGMWEASAKNREKLDYLVARCIERGIYITTDLYVSRPVKWRDIGIDRDGEMNMQLYKTYIGIYEPAYSNWCVHAKAFLEHVNPYTGRAYKDEPGMPFISLVNEGCLGSWTAKKGDEKVLSAWREFVGKDDEPLSKDKMKERLRAFDEWINGKIWAKCSGYVRSLGAKALLTNDNNGQFHGKGEGLTQLYDYVDNHFYVDHPSFIEKPWELPSRCDNRNPICTGKPRMLHAGWAKGFAKPYTITEWNFSGPGRYRGMGGILTGVLAAKQEWDGLWRFAYSHIKENLKDDPNRRPGYFDCASDPLIAASDRASVCLYLRNDAAAGSFEMDKTVGSMTFISPRTCGGFAEGGMIVAGPLSFSVCLNDIVRRSVPTTLWVSTLDGKSICESSRMLLTHLTDIQGDGTKFADDIHTILLKWGRGCLVEVGVAEVSLRLKEPQRYQVWALASDGERRFAMPCRVENGALLFAASTCGADGKGVMQYEIFCDK